MQANYLRATIISNITYHKVNTRTSRYIVIAVDNYFNYELK